MDELLGSGGVTPSPTAALEPAYRPPAVPGGRPVTVPAPPVWEEAAWILEAVAVGCPWPVCLPKTPSVQVRRHAHTR